MIFFRPGSVWALGGWPAGLDFFRRRIDDLAIVRMYAPARDMAARDFLSIQSMTFFRSKKKSVALMLSVKLFCLGRAIAYAPSAIPLSSPRTSDIFALRGLGLGVNGWKSRGSLGS